MKHIGSAVLRMTDVKIYSDIWNAFVSSSDRHYRLDDQIRQGVTVPIAGVVPPDAKREIVSFFWRL